MDALLRDVRHALRTLRRSPGFTLIAVLMLAVGIGAATAIFSVVQGVLLRPLPYPDPDRIIQLWQVNGVGAQSQVSDPNFADWAAQSRSFAALAQFQRNTASVLGGHEPVRRPIAWVSRDFFQVMGVQPVIGRTFVPEEQQEGGARAVVISHRFWQEQFQGTDDLDAQALGFGGELYTVVGVMPPNFDFPDGAALWTARELEPVLPSRTAHNWRVVGRLRDGATLVQAREEISRISRELRQQHGSDTWMTDAAVVPLHEEQVGRVRPVLLVLLGATGFLLLVAIANVTNLLLARMAGRHREMSVRVALGAGAWRLARQTLAESLILCLAGGLLGLVVARVGVQALLAAEPGNLPRVEEIAVSSGALAFALGLSVLAALVLGVLSALRASSADMRGALGLGARASSRSFATLRLQNGLVAAQVALTLCLLVGAGLLGRSIQRLLATDLGFRTESVVALTLSHPAVGGERLAHLHDQIVAAMRAISGVEEVGGSNQLPLTAGGADGTFLIQHHPGEVASFEDWNALSKTPERTGYATFVVASDGYFRALGIPLLRGRLFDDRDASDAPQVALISESLARTRWPGEDPTGKLINFANMDGDLRPLTVVGVVGDVRARAIDAEPEPTVYASYRQRPTRTTEFSYVISGARGAAALGGDVRRAAAELAPDAPPRFRTIEEIVAAPLAPRRFSLMLLGMFGATALVLAALGIYGVTAYSVTQRTRELGIRMALGAAGDRMLGMVVRQGAMVALVGLGVGVLAASGLTRFISSQLYGIQETDPLTFAGAILFLAVIAVVACYIPARRATRVDPMVVLRTE